MRALDLLIFGGDDCCKIPITLIDQPGAGFLSVGKGLHLDYLCPARTLSSSIAVTNFGVWFFSSFSIPGSNSCKTLIPTLLPIVEPKSLNGSAKRRLQYGVEAVSLATEVNIRSRYEVFSVAFPKSSRVIRVREAA